VSLRGPVSHHSTTYASENRCPWNRLSAVLFRIFVSERFSRKRVLLQAAVHHFATFTLKVTVFAPPAFLMTNLYAPSLVAVTLTEHFGPGESSLVISLPEVS
jgi:hypothetical protein